MDYQEVLWVAVFLLHCILTPPVDMALPGATTGSKSNRKTTSVKGEYCSKEKFNATCDSDEVLLMHSAKFGRMRFGKCMKEDHGHVGCSADVLMHLDGICSGRQSCLLDIQDETLQKLHPCPKELMSFLEAEYSCVPVVANRNQVCRQSQPVVLPQPPGYLSSSITDRSGFGLPNCPWTLTVEPGRRIRLSIFNFASSKTMGSRRATCEPYLSVLDQKRKTNITICRGDVRRKEVYVSQKNALQLHILPAPKDASEPRRFLVSYEAGGCADLKAPPHAFSKRVGNTAFVKCNYTAATYFLTCEGNSWIGEVGNCSKAPAHWKADGKGSASTRFPYGILVVIGIGVALGVAVGIVLLMSILICFRRRKERQLRSLTTDPLLEDHHHDHDENTAQCNCGAKIYYATRAEMQCQLAMSSMTVRDPLVEGASDLPDIPASHYHGVPAGGQGLPMPDMCVVDNRPTGEQPASKPPESVPNESSPRRQMQTSFITFKPMQGGTSPESVYNKPNAGSPRNVKSGSPARNQGTRRTETPISEAIINGDSPKVTSKLLSDPRSRDPRTRYKKVKSLEDPYGTRVPPPGNIYEKRLSQLPCAECAKETINANNVNAAQEQAAANKSV